MSTSSRLLIPMYMEALLLRRDKNDCLDISPQLDLTSQSILGEIFQPSGKKNVTLGKGVHLHWTLPKALKHSFLDEGEEMKFPYVPNRWMVVRIQTDKGVSNIPARIWVVESDHKNNTTDSFNLVLVKDQKLVFSNIGSAFDYPYTPAVQSEPVLTAVGAANPFFASFYPGCKNVFGFHDNMSDVPNNSTVSYIVTGWYANAANDPLAPPDFTGTPQTPQQKNKQRELEWFKQKWKCTAETYPTNSMLHSSVQSVQWNDNAPADGVPQGPVELFAGNTSVEAFSAKIRKSSGDSKPGMEELLNALQYQLLEDDRNPPGMEAINEETHRRGFNSKNGGVSWVIKRIEASDQQLQETKEKRKHFPQDAGILRDLKELNRLQSQLNNLMRETLSWQQEYYFLWYKQAKKVVDDLAPPAAFNFENLRREALGIIQANTGQAIPALSKQVEDLKTKLKGYTELKGTTPEFILEEKQSERYWEANEPVLLLSGSGVGNVDKPNFQADDKELICRAGEQVVRRLELVVQNIPVKILPANFSVPAVDRLTGSTIPWQEIKSVIYESILFDEALAVDIALLAYQAAGLGDQKDKSSSVVQAFANDVKKAQGKVLGKEVPADSEKATILPPAIIAVNKWRQAWSPLYMLWEARYHSSYPQATNLDLANDPLWQMEDGLFYKNTSVKKDDTPPSIINISPFSASVFANLKRVLPPDVTAKYGPMNLIAQSLSGLHKVLLTQKPTTQLPPVKYTIDKIYRFDSDFAADQDELRVIGSDGYRMGADPGDVAGTYGQPFYPLRSGFVELLNLSIVDAFGQVKVIIKSDGGNNPAVTCAGNMKGKVNIPSNFIPLAPRVMQPSRLQFQWLNAKDEVVYQDTGNTDSPVFGWVVPNFLDNSLMVYDGSGKEVVILQITKDISKPKGISLLKIPFPGEAIPALADNPHLLKFINSVTSGAIVDGLIDLALKVNLNITDTNALQNNTTASICGQPVALARCSVRLETQGRLHFDQRWAQSGKRNTGGIETVKIPVYAGNFQKERDGLLGFFSDADSTPAFYATKNAPVFKNSAGEPFFKKNAPVKLSVAAAPVKLTLMVDPSAGIHLSSGVLPTKYVELFTHGALDLLSSLNTSFMVTPFLAEKTDPGVPIPSGINASWKWTHKSDVNTWQKDKDVAEGKNKQRSVFRKQQVYEGWLKLNNLKTNN